MSSPTAERRRVSGYWGCALVAAAVVGWDVVAISTRRMETISSAVRRFRDLCPEASEAVSDSLAMLTHHLTRP